MILSIIIISITTTTTTHIITNGLTDKVGCHFVRDVPTTVIITISDSEVKAIMGWKGAIGGSDRNDMRTVVPTLVVLLVLALSSPPPCNTWAGSLE